MMKKQILGILLGLFVFGSAFAQQVSVKIDTNAILIGQQVKVDVDFRLPSDKQGFFPLIKDSLAPNLEVVGKTSIDTTNKNGQTRFYQQLKVTSFDSGYFVLPAFSFRYKNSGDTAIHTLVSDPHLINVFTVKADTTKPIKPIVGPMREPYTFTEFLPWILFGMAIVGLVFAAFYFYRRRKKKPLFKKQEPQLPPHEKALDDLARLRLKKLWQAGKVKEYYTELTDILRIYIEERFDVAAVEMTSSEILEGLAPKNINDQAMQKLRGSLELSDLVKFAKASPTALENDTCLNNGVDFITETKAIEEPPAETEQKEEEVKDVE